MKTIISITYILLAIFINSPVVSAQDWQVEHERQYQKDKARRELEEIQRQQEILRQELEAQRRKSQQELDAQRRSAQKQKNKTARDVNLHYLGKEIEAKRKILVDDLAYLAKAQETRYLSKSEIKWLRAKMVYVHKMNTG